MRVKIFYKAALNIEVLISINFMFTKMQNVLFDANEKALCVNLYSLKYLYLFETSVLIFLSPIVYLKDFLMLGTNFISLGSCFSNVVIVNLLNSSSETSA